MTLGQLLKEANIIASGGQAKWYLAENAVYVNGELENRRGRKLYAGMMVRNKRRGRSLSAHLRKMRKQIMFLNKLQLKHFRNYEELSLDFKKNLVIFFGR